ncbi:acyltransferase family protein, partial [bacterium]|nr:acyltransferase family protein [bacterium]
MSYLLYIDILKAIGILFVISGHVFGFDNKFSVYIHSFHVPLFFFISGYLFHNYNVKNFISKRFKRLILPYFGYGILNFLLCILLFKNFDYKGFIASLFLYNNEPSIPVVGALWFLTGLFFANVIFFFINKIFAKYALIPIFLIVGLEMFFKLKLPYSIDTAIFMLPIIYVGYKFRNFEWKFKPFHEFLIAAFILALTFFTIFLNGDVNTRTNTYENLILFYFNAIFVSVGYYYLAKFLENLKYMNILGEIGKYSLELMCIHQVILFCFVENLNIKNNTILLIITLCSSGLIIFVAN